jgi:hypothetical protein
MNQDAGRRWHCGRELFPQNPGEPLLNVNMNSPDELDRLDSWFLERHWRTETLGSSERPPFEEWDEHRKRIEVAIMEPLDNLARRLVCGPEMPESIPLKDAVTLLRICEDARLATEKLGAAVPCEIAVFDRFRDFANELPYVLGLERGVLIPEPPTLNEAIRGLREELNAYDTNTADWKRRLAERGLL